MNEETIELDKKGKYTVKFGCACCKGKVFMTTTSKKVLGNALERTVSNSEIIRVDESLSGFVDAVLVTPPNSQGGIQP